MNHGIPMSLPTKAVRVTLDLLELLFKGDAARQVGVRLWDGTCWPDDEPRPAILVLKHPGALRAMLLPGTEVGLGEAYLYDDFDIEGNVESVFGLADSSLHGMAPGLAEKLHVGNELPACRPANAGGKHAAARPG